MGAQSAQSALDRDRCLTPFLVRHHPPGAGATPGIIPAMARRILAWLLVTPLAGAGVLAAHAVAYGLTGADPGPEHGYLEHVPQVAGLLACLAVLGLALQERSPRP